MFFAGVGWNGTHQVGGEMFETLDTHSNTLAAGGGKAFVFGKAGPYTMRLVVENSGAWHDVLDVYEARFNVAPPPAPRKPGARR